MQQTQNVLEKVVLESNNNIYSLSAQIIQLRVVQQATSHLMDKIDEITHKGWHKDIGMAHAAILEIQDTLRLIDMAFFPLYKDMSEEVDILNIHAQELYNTVIGESEAQSV
ncbi:MULTISPECIES: hypothetical protein [unclassified Lysinibacillus]|uniref:hypothetical protein n=1 Tax=unclassified Lysinibacillus TaxID=2636778 RepID=UPI0038200275